MISRSSRWMVSNPITCCSVMRWASTPRGMECPQHKKTEGAFRPLERGSQGWTVALMERATRFLWELRCGRKDRKLFQQAMRLLCDVIQHTSDLTLLTDGEGRLGGWWFG